MPQTPATQRRNIKPREARLSDQLNDNRHAHPRTSTVWHDPFDRHDQRGRQPPGDALRLGVLYADGRRGATTGEHWPDQAADLSRLFL
jgi:hypothetical protein